MFVWTLGDVIGLSILASAVVVYLLMLLIAVVSTWIDEAKTFFKKLKAKL